MSVLPLQLVAKQGLYTHSHVDHFGGVDGVVTDEVPILAPEGFLEHAVSENADAGPATSRRATFNRHTVTGWLLFCPRAAAPVAA